MPEAARQILAVFKENGSKPGDVLAKEIVLGRIKELNIDMSEVRNAWHFLMGEGLIRQVGNNIELTNRGASELGD